MVPTVLHFSKLYVWSKSCLNVSSLNHAQHLVQGLEHQRDPINTCWIVMCMLTPKSHFRIRIHLPLTYKWAISACFRGCSQSHSYSHTTPRAGLAIIALSPVFHWPAQSHGQTSLFQCQRAALGGHLIGEYWLVGLGSSGCNKEHLAQPALLK